MLFGTGDGSFSTAQFFTVGDRPTGLVATDLNGDQRADILVSNADSNDLSLILQ